MKKDYRFFLVADREMATTTFKGLPKELFSVFPKKMEHDLPEANWMDPCVFPEDSKLSMDLKCTDRPEEPRHTYVGIFRGKRNFNRTWKALNQLAIELQAQGIGVKTTVYTFQNEEVQKGAVMSP